MLACRFRILALPLLAFVLAVVAWPAAAKAHGGPHPRSGTGVFIASTVHDAGSGTNARSPRRMAIAPPDCLPQDCPGTARAAHRGSDSGAHGAAASCCCEAGCSPCVLLPSGIIANWSGRARTHILPPARTRHGPAPPRLERPPRLG